MLAYGDVLRKLYLRRGWAKRAWTWHEAADTRVFRPIADRPSEGDLVWVGNWGDEERTAELHEFLLGPVKALGLKARVHGVRYPQHALDALREAGIVFGGWLPNYRAPETFAGFRVTVHVPRRPYVEALPGIPTIACLRRSPAASHWFARRGKTWRGCLPRVVIISSRGTGRRCDGTSLRS